MTMLGGTARTMPKTGVALAFLLVILSVSSVSAGVEIGVSSPSLDNLIVVPGQEFLIGIRVYNNGDNVFVAHLEATEEVYDYDNVLHENVPIYDNENNLVGYENQWNWEIIGSHLENLPVTFAKNDFELMAGTSVQVKTTFRIPSGWQMGENREGDISVTALTPKGPSDEGAASAHVLGSISKHVVIRVGEEPSVPEEPWEPVIPLNLTVFLGVEQGAPKPDNVFRQDEVLLVTAEVDGEADIFFVFHDPQAGNVQVPMNKESEYYVGMLDLRDVTPGTYLLQVVARGEGVEEEVAVTFQVEASVSGFPIGLVVAVAATLVAFFALFATRRKWLHRIIKKKQLKE